MCRCPNPGQHGVLAVFSRPAARLPFLSFRRAVTATALSELHESRDHGSGDGSVSGAAMSQKSRKATQRSWFARSAKLGEDAGRVTRSESADLYSERRPFAAQL